MTPDFQSDDGAVQLWCADCLDVLPTLSGIDAVITDPPYGMNNDTDNSRFSGGNIASVVRSGNGVGTGSGVAIIGDDKPFDPSPWLGFPAVVIFGSNHFAQRLPVGTTLVWLKRFDIGFGTFLSDGEIAWMKGGCGVYMGSGTTGIACIRTGRRFLGIEKDPRYFEIARDRIKRELAQGKLAL